MEITARSTVLTLAETFTIARESQDVAEVVEVEVAHGDVTGFGEAAPIARYEQTAASALAWLEAVELGDDPWALDEIAASLPPGEAAARAALDAALHDLQGKLAGVPVYRLLGLRREGPPTSWTVWLGDPDEMARRAEAAEQRGFMRLKLKLGGRDGLDLERVRAVRSATTLPLQVDVNEYWTLEEALELLPADADRVLRAAASRRRSHGCRAEAPLTGSDLRGRGLPHACRRRPLRRAGARDQHQAREVGRDSRSGANGERRARARARR